MIIDLDDGDQLICHEDPADPWIDCEYCPPGIGQIAIFMCGNGKKRVGYGRGLELGPALFYEKEDDYLSSPLTLKCWKKGPEPSLALCSKRTWIETKAWLQANEA